MFVAGFGAGMFGAPDCSREQFGEIPARTRYWRARLEAFLNETHLGKLGPRDQERGPVEMLTPIGSPYRRMVQRSRQPAQSKVLPTHRKVPIPLPRSMLRRHGVPPDTMTACLAQEVQSQSREKREKSSIFRQLANFLWRSPRLGERRQGLPRSWSDTQAPGSGSSVFNRRKTALGGAIGGGRDTILV